MDPDKIKLRTHQKVIPLLKAIDKEIPWQMICISVVCLTSAVVIPTHIPPFISEAWWDFAVRRVLLGFASAFVTFLVCGFSYMFIEDKMIPLFRKIVKNYEEETYEVKKKVLDDVIDDEILLKK